MNKNSIALRYGIIAGVSTVAYYLLFYLFARVHFFDLAIWWGGLLPVIALMFITLQKEKMKLGGQLNLFQGLQSAFLVFVIGIGLFYIFYFVLVKYIDPDLLLVQKETALRNLERYGGSEAKDLDSYKDYYEEGKPDFTLSGLLFRYFQSLIGGFILSLALAFALRTE